ncbi:MAG: glycosyltransferase [Mycobacteriaceae bacterium]
MSNRAMRVLFAIVDGGGNVPPQLAVARELHKRGVDVRIIGHSGIAERVQKARIPFETFSNGRHFDPTTPRPLPAMMFDFAQLAADRNLGRSITEAAQRFGAHAVVADTMLVGALPEVERTGVPTIVFVHCFYRAVQDLAAGPVGWFLRARGIDPRFAERRGLLQIVSARKDLDPLRGTPPVSHIGVTWQGTPAAAVPATVPRILVSLSTNAFAGQRRMLQNILDAMETLPVEATLTVGPSIDASGLRVPANTDVHTWLDHDEVLATASLVVGHGGHSTAMRALSFGVPQVIMPANPMIDQKRVGASLRDQGVGVLLAKYARPEKIRAAIEAVLRDPSYRENAARLGEDIRRRDGAAVAADIIGEHVRASAPT